MGVGPSNPDNIQQEEAKQETQSSSEDGCKHNKQDGTKAMGETPFVGETRRETMETSSRKTSERGGGRRRSGEKRSSKSKSRSSRREGGDGGGRSEREERVRSPRNRDGGREKEKERGGRDRDRDRDRDWPQNSRFAGMNHPVGGETSSPRDRRQPSNDASSPVYADRRLITPDMTAVPGSVGGTAGGGRDYDGLNVSELDSAIYDARPGPGARTGGRGGGRPGRENGRARAGGARSPVATKVPDAVHNNPLPMADLMVYLQLVANNSSNLPLTRRDDPELGRTVSSLTAEEYATKCAAFVPANVRIIGGQFLKYGRVWDLPTSEEFEIMNSALEPGIAHGGACCNALLKAMYDTESETHAIAGAASGGDYMGMDHRNLFDDDDDETIDTAGYTIDRGAASFDTLVLNDGVSAPSTMTWATLLRKMKAEMQGVGFSQVPAITASFKFDLNQPFGLVPPEFKPGINKKRSLLIGCNYKKTPEAGLKACHDDVRSMKDFLVNVYGFPEIPEFMTVLMDDKDHRHPTRQNIANAFRDIADKSQPGDAVFILFTGHGCRILDSPIDSEAESYDEALVPSDVDEVGLLRDTLIFKTLLAPLRKGVSVTCIIDSCHTGVMIDLPYLWTTKNDRSDTIAKMSLNDDFSFVRFLKVVKTLYESSVFTKIGKTVGSELNKHTPGREDDDDTADHTVDGSLVTMPENEPASGAEQQASTAGGLFQLLSCQSPKEIANKVINCTLHAPDEFSDDDTMQRNNTMDDEETLESYGTKTS